MSSIPHAAFHEAGRILAFSISALLLDAGAAAPEPATYQAGADADGVQRVALVGGSYFFRPEHIVAQADRPLEITVSLQPGLIPHRFVLEAPDGQKLANVSLGAEARTVRLTLKAGDYVFYCPNQLLQFKSHRERGMAGVLQVRE